MKGNCIMRTTFGDRALSMISTILTRLRIRSRLILTVDRLMGLLLQNMGQAANEAYIQAVDTSRATLNRVDPLITIVRRLR